VTPRSQFSFWTTATFLKTLCPPLMLDSPPPNLSPCFKPGSELPSPLHVTDVEIHPPDHFFRTFLIDFSNVMTRIYPADLDENPQSPHPSSMRPPFLRSCSPSPSPELSCFPQPYEQIWASVTCCRIAQGPSDTSPPRKC